ncbi:divergent PAP2 family protein [Candidatus Epulonipiscium viviparus]|uniref:divergent PAP2 family protein n=1 Tax=Candidatus Epulonipiscium viviparus TaxID=420336 RepID=UPI00049579C7|nr:divergent PAP2 family protein [Candidatus Epulopiscium viviparus]
MTNWIISPSLIIAIISWFIAQVLKIVITLVHDKKFDIAKLTASGGMPSSHSAFTVALSTAIGQLEGYNTTMFAVACVFSCVVMYDAANVRMQAGNQAILLNEIMEHLKDQKKFDIDFTLKELLGHTPTQVFCGAVLGMAVAILGLPYFV